MPRAALALASTLIVLCLGACSPRLSPGVDKDRLDQAVSQAIGDPNSCLLIGKAGSGQIVYRYNSHTACALAFPACDTPGARTTDGLLAATARDGQPRRFSCNTLADGSRGVGWASGPIPGRALVYAAGMEGTRAFPGRMMAERLEGAFREAGL
jgi:hypothetical protein